MSLCLFFYLFIYYSFFFLVVPLFLLLLLVSSHLPYAYFLLPFHPDFLYLLPSFLLLSPVPPFIHHRQIPSSVFPSTPPFLSPLHFCTVLFTCPSLLSFCHTFTLSLFLPSSLFSFSLNIVLTILHSSLSLVLPSYIFPLHSIFFPLSSQLPFLSSYQQEPPNPPPQAASRSSSLLINHHSSVFRPRPNSFPSPPPSPLSLLHQPAPIPISFPFLLPLHCM